MKGVRTIPLSFLLVHFLNISTLAQQTDPAPLFRDEQRLVAEFSISLAEVKKNKSDSTYFSTILRYTDTQGVWDSIPIGVRARGNFRRKHCFLPPMRIKFNKNDTRGTLFAGTKSLKLVLPCQHAKSSNDLVMKEYMCYQLYEPVTPFVFETRLVDVTLYDRSGKQPRTYKLTGFLLKMMMPQRDVFRLKWSMRPDSTPCT